MSARLAGVVLASRAGVALRQSLRNDSVGFTLLARRAGM